MSTINTSLILGALAGAALIPLLWLLLRAVTIEVEDEEAVLLTRFGRLAAVLDRPGLHRVLDKLLPWVHTTRVSLRRDFRSFTNVHVNDARGTTVMIDLWLEFRIADPRKAVFQVADWDRSLQNLVAHAATSILGNRELHQILCDRVELGELLRRDIGPETTRWGLEIEQLLIAKVSLLPEVSRQIFETVAARLERAKADVEETGRLKVAMLEADTSVQVAKLVAEAKGQYPHAIGRALEELRFRPSVLKAYMELHELAQVRPHRTVSFRGFADGEIRPIEGAMLTAPPDGAPRLDPASSE